MEVLKMKYYFAGLIILALTILTFFVEPAYPRNEYLNDGNSRCGELEVRTERRDTDYNYSDGSTNEQQGIIFTYRKYLGTDCETSKENVAIKQQLELMKMCGRVNSNPSLANNSNFDLLVSKCRGVTPSRDNTRPSDSQSLWDDLKDEYKKENPEVNLMGDKFIKSKKSTLKVPPKDYKLPKPKDE
jgi:hypothetical protein|tara:strand:+ start:905 stop:1462 length:558 start_codon:yes stop_codon:yes gene_type:complete